MTMTTETDARRLSRRTMLTGFAAAAGAALLAACGGSTAPTVSRLATAANVRWSAGWPTRSSSLAADSGRTGWMSSAAMRTASMVR